MSGLRDKAHGTEVAQSDEAKQRELMNAAIANIRKMEEQFAVAMPKGAEAAQLVRDAMTLVRQTPKLAVCDQSTLFGGLMTMAQLGLRPGVLGHGWLLPFYDTKSRGFKAQLVIGYQGYVELGYRSNKVAAISARTVFANDPIFEVAYGTQDELFHTPLLSGDRGDPIAYYAVVHIKGGRPMFYLKDKAGMEEHRDRYAMAKTREGVIVGPWVNQFEGMAHKTCLRQLAKWMPKSADLATALAVDEGFRSDLRGKAEETTWHVEQVNEPDAEGNEPPADSEQGVNE